MKVDKRILLNGHDETYRKASEIVKKTGETVAIDDGTGRICKIFFEYNGQIFEAVPQE